jgi:SIT family siderophore-iron:H+ symporter-like MFS transporter
VPFGVLSVSPSLSTLVSSSTFFQIWSVIAHVTAAWSCQGDYLFTILIVGFNESIKSATRITSLYSFVSVIVGILVGILVSQTRRLKALILFGTCLFMIAFILLIHYRGGTGRTAHWGLIGGQVLLGVAGGFFPYPALVSIQAAVKHEHLAVITGVYLASYNIGSALGNAVSGAIWTNIVPRELNSRIANSTLAAQWFSLPLTMVLDYPPGTPDRDAAIVVFKYVQSLICTIGLGLCAVLIFFACVIRNPKLGYEQSLPDAEERGKAPPARQGEEVKSRFGFWKN